MVHPHLSRREALAASLLAFAAPSTIAFARAGDAAWPQGEDLGRIADDVVRAALAAEGIPGAAFVCFDAKGRQSARHWGMADREASLAVSDATVWPIASVTKVLTATATLIWVDHGLLDLDDDVRTYMHSVRIPERDGPPITLRCLLSHTSGLDEVPGRMWDAAKPMPRIAPFLDGKLVRVRAAGELTAYSSYGIALVSAIIEELSRRRYEDFVRATLFEPIGMRAGRFMRAAKDAQGVTVPYAIEDKRATRMKHEFYITAGTSSAVCTIGDMARLGAMLLNDGAVGANHVLSRDMTAEMMRQQATIHPGVPGWGLGVQLDEVGGRRIVEHGGDVGGFACLFTLVPDAGVGFFTVHHGEGGDLRFRVRDALLASIALSKPQAPTADGAAARKLGEYTGRYRSTLECFSCGGDAGANAFECKIADNATLSLWGQTWVPVGGDLFIRDDGVRKLGFARDKSGRVTAVTGGSWRVAVKIS